MASQSASQFPRPPVTTASKNRTLAPGSDNVPLAPTSPGISSSAVGRVAQDALNDNHMVSYRPTAPAFQPSNRGHILKAGINANVPQRAPRTQPAISPLLPLNPSDILDINSRPSHMFCWGHCGMQFPTLPSLLQHLENGCTHARLPAGALWIAAGSAPHASCYMIPTVHSMASNGLLPCIGHDSQNWPLVCPGCSYRFDRLSVWAMHVLGACDGCGQWEMGLVSELEHQVQIWMGNWLARLGLLPGR